MLVSTRLAAIGILACVTATSATARGEVPFQGGVHGGVECFQECSLTVAAVGASAFWVPGRVVALGVMAEYANTANIEERGDTGRVGVALRTYFARRG